MNKQELYNLIALSQVRLVGPVAAKKLIAYCGSAEAVFKEKKSALIKIPGIGTIVSAELNNTTAFETAEKELEFINKNKITPLSFWCENYPKRLVHCEDSPILLYSRGKTNFNVQKVLSIIGTRKATSYGKAICEKLIEELASSHPNLLIVSGLAYGVDICAQRAAYKNNLQTIGVLAHGLDRIYPSSHGSFVNKSLTNGGICSDFVSNTNPDRENFPKRNRIVAGLADATLVIESKINGGSMITANLAHSYNRDVLAIPGNVNNEFSKGTNELIKSQRASLVESASDIEKLMLWKAQDAKKPVQASLFSDISKEQEQIVTLLRDKGTLNIDDLSFMLKTKTSDTSFQLLDLEFKGIVKSNPGKTYSIL